MHRITPVLALIAAAGIAACGSTTTSTTAAAKTGQMVTFAKCMRSHGVPNFPDPGTNGSGGIQIAVGSTAGSGNSLKVNGVSVNAPEFQSAMNSCRHDLPNGGHPPPLSATQRAAMLQFSQCMRANGVPNFPDPTFATGGRIRLQLKPGDGIDPNSPGFQHAQTACAKYRDILKGPGG
jgi:hypothetical protein